MSKQETLEEAAERLYPTDYGEKSKNIINMIKLDAFVSGIKWQQERSYSEEEVYNMIIDLLKRKQIGQIIDYGDIHEWFEQYYKIK